MDFYDPKVFGDTFIFDGLVYLSRVFQIIKRQLFSKFGEIEEEICLPACLPSTETQGGFELKTK